MKGILKRKEVILEDLHHSGLNKGDVSEDDVVEPSSSKFVLNIFRISIPRFLCKLP